MRKTPKPDEDSPPDAARYSLYRKSPPKNLSGNPPECACGCKNSVTFNYYKDKWNICLVGHMRKTTKVKYGEDTCWICEKKYERTAPSQSRCKDCKGKHLREKNPPPFCACGCGTAVRWNKHTREWRKLVKNHAIKGTGHYRQGYKFSTKSNISEHRQLAARNIGRALLAIEEVHHIDQDRSNNNPDNLFVFHCTACHLHAHNGEKPLAYYYAEVHDAALMREAVEKHTGRKLIGRETVLHITHGNKEWTINELFLFHCDGCRSYATKSAIKMHYHYPHIHQSNPSHATSNQASRLRIKQKSKVS